MSCGQVVIVAQGILGALRLFWAFWTRLSADYLGGREGDKSLGNGFGGSSNANGASCECSVRAPNFYRNVIDTRDVDPNVGNTITQGACELRREVPGIFQFKRKEPAESSL